MKQRTITAIFFAAAVLTGIYSAPIGYFILFTLVGAGMLWELHNMLFDRDEQGFAFRRLAGLVVGILPFALYAGAIWSGWHTQLVRGLPAFPANSEGLDLNDAAYWLITTAIVVLEILLLFVLLTIELFLSSKRPFPNVGNYLLGILYVGAPITMLTEIAYWTGDYGPHRVFGIMGLVWVNDSTAYLAGSFFGKNKLFERISPKKTWEGALGGVAGTILVAWLASMYIHEYTTAQWLGVAIVVAIIGTLGDLVESMLKRSVGVKDSGALFPGHGGFLDRFDAFVYVLPFSWAILLML